MKYCTNCVSPSSAPLLGKTSSNGCYYALRQNKNIISASNSSPSHSLTLESFAQVKTCNQFDAIGKFVQVYAFYVGEVRTVSVPPAKRVACGVWPSQRRRMVT